MHPKNSKEQKLLRQMALAAGLGLAALSFASCGGSSTGNGTGTVVATMSTLAGSGATGTTDGPGNVALFNNPANVATDTAGNVYVSDFDNSRVRRITPAGVVDTLVNQANFFRPFGITFTTGGELFVQTDGNDTGGNDSTTGTIWRVNIAAKTATVVASNLGRPRGLTALPDGRLVLVDNQHHYIRLMNTTTGATTFLAGKIDTPGFADGDGAAVQFNRCYGAAITPSGNILVADTNNFRLRLVTPAGHVTTFAGNGTHGYVDGTLSTAQFGTMQDVAIDAAGNVYVCDDHRLRRIDPAGNVSSLIGNGNACFADGMGKEAEFYGGEGHTVLKDGSAVFIADGNGGDPVPYNRIRKVTFAIQNP